MSLTVNEARNWTLSGIVALNGVAQDLTGWVLVFAVNTPNGTRLITKSTADHTQINPLNSPLGSFEIYGLPADTVGQLGTPLLRYELKGTDPDGNVWTLDGLAPFIIQPTIA